MSNNAKTAGLPAYKRAAVAALVPYARNSRTHSAAQVDKIAASIREFGFLNPVITDGSNGIIAGHGRILAAQKLGIDEVPTIDAAHLTDAQRRAYIIADNRLALDAGWDDEMLRVELGDLKDAGFDLALTGFDLDEIQKISFDDDAEADMPDMPTGDRSAFRQATFTLTEDQAEAVQEALSKAKGLGPFVDTGNENSNGNALARACEMFNGIR